MLTYSTYSEAGGIGKTTFAASFSHAHVKHGCDTLLIDMDPQDGDVSYLLGVDDDRDRDDVDTLTHHLAGAPQGDFADLIRTTEEGIDVIPAHNSLSALDSWFDDAEEHIDGFDRFTRLQEVLQEEQIHEQYDVLVVDPPATEGPQLYNALSATHNLVIPTELTGKGEQAIRGLTSLVEGLEERLGAEIGVLAIVPNQVKHTTDQDYYEDLIEELGYDVPAIIGERASLFEGCWRQQCSAFRYVDEHRDRKRDHEMDTLAKLHRLANHFENSASTEETHG